MPRPTSKAKPLGGPSRPRKGSASRASLNHSWAGGSPAANLLRLGIVGTGVAAVKHYLPALKSLHDKVRVVACCNRTRSKAEQFAAQLPDVRVLDSAEDLLAAKDVDAVLLSLPIAQLPEYVERSLASGKPVLSEKPIAPNLESARRLISRAGKFDVPWLVGENFAFMPQLSALSGWIDAGLLGRIRLIEVRQMTFIDESNAYFRTSWRQTPEHSGGFVVDGGVHLAHVVRRCFGMPLEIQNATAQFNPRLIPLDTALALLRFESGALGTWVSCFSARYEGPMLRVFGELGNADFGYFGAELSLASGEQRRVPGGDSFRAQFEHFYDVVKRGVPALVTPEQALLDLELISAICSD